MPLKDGMIPREIDDYVENAQMDPQLNKPQREQLIALLNALMPWMGHLIVYEQNTASTMCSASERTRKEGTFMLGLVNFIDELDVDSELTDEVIKILIPRMAQEVEADKALSLEFVWCQLFGGALSDRYHKLLEHPEVVKHTWLYSTLVEWQL